MEVFTKVLEQFGGVVRLQELISSLSNSNPILAGLVIFVITLVLASVIVIQFIEVKDRFLGRWRHSRLAWIGLIVAVSLAGLISAGTVMNLQQLSAAVPVFDKGLDIVIGRPLLLKWSYPDRNARFEIQSSEDPNFVTGVESTTGDGAYFPASHTNGKRFWKVRAVDEKDRGISPWSQPIPVVQYETSLRRIKETHNVSVYISNSFNEAFFKFDVRNNGKRTPKGYDIAIIDEVIERLPSLLKIDGVLTYDLTPVSWDELLNAPQDGRADIIISTITSFRKREEDLGIKFSKPYYCTTQSLIYRPSQPSKSVLEMIERKKVGVQRRTTSQDMMTKFKKDLPEDQKFELKEEYGQAGLMVEAFANHVIDVGLTDTPFARAAQWDYGTDKLAIRELTKPEDFPKELEAERRFERYAIAVRDGENDLVDAIDKAINQMREKKLAELLEKAVEEFYATKGGATRNLPMFDRKSDPSDCESN
jgi:ABC-type amino acid transport substrate-binding protein